MKLLIKHLILLLPVLVATGCSTKRPSTERYIHEQLRKTDRCISDNSKLSNQIHVMQEGETLYKLSRIYNVGVNELINTNRIDDPTDIETGKIISIPGTYNKYFQWPTIGKITSYYGKRRRNFHAGIDISAKKGTDIRSVSDGMVITSGNSLEGYSKYGKIIVIDHGNGIQSLYAHNDKIFVEEGQCVKMGEKIAEVGKTGNATGPHVHLEIIKDGKTVNPLKYLIREDEFERH